MSLTVIPAPDQSAAAAGWQMLAEAAIKRRQSQRAEYQEMIKLLSDPNTTEEQQNAVLTQDPKMFKRTYGVPLEQVGKDVTRYRTAVTGVATPEIASKRRLLVEHPAGTPGEQQAAATLAQTQATTVADNQRTEYYTQQLGLNAQEARQKDLTFRGDLRNNMRTADGKTPTPAQVTDYMAGTFDLYPTTEAGKRLESAREILGGDSNDPASALLQHDMALDSDIKDASLDHLKAQTAALRKENEVRDARLAMYDQGINPNTGRPVTDNDRVDPKDVIASGKAFNEALTKSLGPLGYPSQVESKKPWSLASVAAGRYTITKDPKLAAVLFGSGVTDPASVRADLLAAFPAGNKPRTITIPTIDSKGMLIDQALTIDQAVPAIVQVRRQLATQMPPVFAALRATSPQTLFEISIADPLIAQMARIYAPDMAKIIDEARAARKSTLAPAAAAAPAAPIDSNIAPILELRDSMQREIDDIKRSIQGASAVPRSDQAR